MPHKFSKTEKILDKVTSAAAFTYAEVDMYMRDAMESFTEGKHTGDDIKMHKGIEMALAAAGACIILKTHLQTAASLMQKITKEE